MKLWWIHAVLPYLLQCPCSLTKNILLLHLQTNDPEAMKCVHIPSFPNNPFIPTHLAEEISQSSHRRKPSVAEFTYGYLTQSAAKFSASLTQKINEQRRKQEDEKSKKGADSKTIASNNDRIKFFKHSEIDLTTRSTALVDSSITDLKENDNNDNNTEKENRKIVMNSSKSFDFTYQNESSIDYMFSKATFPMAEENKNTKSSKLSALFVEKQTTSNPFECDFGIFRGMGIPNAIRLKMYFPSSENPQKALNLTVKPDVTVEDVIGYALYEYYNDKRQPVLPSSMQSIAKWTMKIVEDDGMIDEDFPALDRTRKIQRFGFDQFALCEATASEIEANMLLLAERNINLETSQANFTIGRMMSVKSPKESPMSGATPTVSSPVGGNTQFIKIHLYSTLTVKQTTTMQTLSNIPLSEVFENICKKRKYDSKDYVLKLADTKTDAPLDKTLDQLKISELCVLKKDRGGAGDIFLRPPNEDDGMADDSYKKRVLSGDEFTAQYKQYIVYHKQLLGKQFRKLTIDGQFIHIMAGENGSRNIFDLRGKTTTYHIADIISCQQVKKNSVSFKMLVQKGLDSRCLELEASDSSEALEICNKITIMKQLRPSA